MEKLLIVLFIVLGVVGVVSTFFSREKIQRYIQSRGGKHVSTICENKHQTRNKFYIIKYYDKHNNLRTVTYHSNGLFSNFDQDIIIEYSTSSPEYFEYQKQLHESDKRAKEFEEFIYQVKEGELYIKQEFTNPNKGEYVYLNGNKAPNGSYKLGFMNYITVENGKITDISVI